MEDIVRRIVTQCETQKVIIAEKEQQLTKLTWRDPTGSRRSGKTYAEFAANKEEKIKSKSKIIILRANNKNNYKDSDDKLNPVLKNIKIRNVKKIRSKGILLETDSVRSK